LEDIRLKGSGVTRDSFDRGNGPKSFDVQDLDELIAGEQGPVFIADFKDIALIELFSIVKNE
jgi:hypothetical protein